MEAFLEIIKYTLPALLVVLITYLMLSNFMDNEEKRRSYLLRRETRKASLSYKLQAYERISLFLERITPNSLLVRVPAKKLEVRDYHVLLLKSIRDEYEYNLSQQIYLSDDAWRQVVHAKSATVGILNKMVQECRPDEPGVNLSKKVLNYAMELETFPTRQALTFLKSELRSEL
jgi:hypothetical protein